MSTDLSSEAGSVSDSGGFSPFGTSTPASASAGASGLALAAAGASAVSNRKGKGRASMGGVGDDIHGQVEYKVLSLEQLEGQQKDAVNYVQDMLQLKVCRRFPFLF